MIPHFIAIFAFLAAFLTVVAVNALIIDLTSQERKRMRQRLEEQHRARQRAKVRRDTVDFSKIAKEALADRKTDSWKAKAQFILDQSGLDITWSKLLLLCVTSAVCMGVLTAVVFYSTSLTLMAALMTGLMPVGYVWLKRQQRMNALRDQLPDSLELMGRVLRSGQTISQGMHAVADEFDRPIALEFLYCYEQMNMGLSAEIALRELAKRTGLLEIKIFVLAVIVQRQTGGNLAELLDKLGEVIRERFRIKGMIMSLTAQGRLQATIMSSLPGFMFCVLMLMDPDYMSQLFQMPQAIALAVALVIVGWLWANRIVNFDY